MKFASSITPPNALVWFLFSLVGCGAPERGTEITFWGFGAEGENVRALIPEFERQNPGIRVRVQMIPWTAAHEKLLTAYAGNSLPDICQLGNTWIPEFTLLRAIEPLDSWIKASKSIRPENYFPGIWETNKIDSVLYGIPWYVDTRALYYRTDVLQSVGYSMAPRTWDEWLDVSKKIKKRQTNKNRYAVLLPTNEWAPPVIFGLQKGSGLLKENDTKGDFAGAAFRSAFEFYMKFYDLDLAPTGVTQVTNIYQGIAEEFFVMYISGPWNIGEFLRRLPDSLQDKWMTAPLPTADGLFPGTSLAGGSSLVLFRTSDKKKETWKLIEYLSDPSTQMIFHRLTGDLPARREAWLDTTLRNNKYARAFYTQLERVKPTPKVPEWEQIAMKVQEYSEIASMKRMNVTETLEALDREVDKILEKRRWMLERARK